ncbi:MAG: tetratricopeptide repeat protein [Planctomycetota bacterium]|nr:tetratricopeptide repeat protein [Planctomycetota bacterium]
MPDVWGFIADAFYEGMIQDAAQTLQDLRQEESPDDIPDPEVALLRGDVYRALGQEQLFREEIQKSLGGHPKHSRLRLQWVRIRTMQNRLRAAERELDALTDDLDQETQKDDYLLALALKASLYAQWGRSALAREWIKTCAAEGGQERALSNYEIACAHFALKEWDLALDHFRQVAKMAPKWPRPRIFIHHCLNSLSRPSEALNEIEKACKDFSEDVNIVLVLFGHLYSTKHYKRIVAMAGQRGLDLSGPIKNEDVDEHHPYALARGITVRALWHLGQFDKAIASARLLSMDWARVLGEANRKGKKNRVPVKPIVQDRNMCVPACLAMILRSLHPDKSADPQVIYRQMGGTAGVAPWQLDKWLFLNKLQPIDIQVSISAVKGMIDAGFALLATRSRILMSHQELIVGYDETLQELEVIEPTQGVPIYLPFEQLQESYSHAGESLVALIPMTKESRYPTRWIDKEAMNARRALRSIFTANIERAQKQYSELQNGGLIKAQLALRYPEILVPHSELPGLLKTFIQREDADTASRFSAAMLLLETNDQQLAKDVLATIRMSLPLFLRNYVIVLTARSKGDWARMKAACEIMLERSASLADLWFFYSVALQGTGEFEAAEHACRICLEINPSHLGANLQRLTRPSQQLPLIEQQKKIQTLLRFHPRCEVLRGLAAQLAFDLGQPEECEKQLREAARLFPHSPTSHLPLRDFFLIQHRPDLASTVVIPGQSSQSQEREVLDCLQGLAKDQDIATLLQFASAETWQGEPGPAVTELLKKRELGLLTPLDDLSLRQIQLQFVFAEKPDKAVQAPSLTQILPEILPAPEAMNLERLLGDLPLESIERNQAVQILDWSETVMAGREWTPRAKSLTAFLEERAGRTANAAKLYGALAERYNLTHANYRLGIIHMEQGRLHEAVPFFETCIKDKPAHIGAWESLADIHGRFNDSEKCREALETLIRLLPYDPSRAHSLLERYLEDEKSREAKTWLESEGSRYPDSFKEWWGVKLHMHDSCFEKALEAIGPALRKDNPREAYELELEIYNEQGRLTDHQAVIHRALEDFPDDSFFNHLLASVLENDPEQVLAIYIANFKRKPSAPVALEILKRVKEDEILDCFESLITDVGSHGVRVIVYDALTSDGLRQLALQLFERLEKLYPEDPFIIQVLSENYRIFGLVRKNRPKIEQLLRMDSESPGYLWLCGLGLLDYRPKQAREIFAKYYELTADPEALTYLGRSEQLMGHIDEAKQAYWQSLESRKGDAQASSNLYRLGDRRPELMNQFQLAVQNPPDPSLEGFAVLAVEMAVEAKVILSESWEEWATARARGLTDFRNAIPNESADLELMIYIWCKKRKKRELYREIYGSQSKMLGRPLSLFLKKWWWQNEWVPALA